MSNENIIQNNERRAAFMGLGLKLPHLLARVAPNELIATALVADFFDEFLRARARMEPEGFPSALKIEIQKIESRTLDFRNTAIRIYGSNPQLPQFSFERLKKEVEQISRDVATALLLEAKHENFDEFQFWREFFLGMADADPSGVVILAARLVFLDYEEGFRKAFRLDAALAAPSTRH